MCFTVLRTSDRSRHVKCDETRPFCLKCTTLGRHCEGFPNDTHNDAVVLTPTPQEQHIDTYAIPFRIPGGKSERQLFHYFCVRGSGDLSAGKRPEFWKHQLLQLSHNEPLIRKALIALSSVQLDFARAPDIRLSIESPPTLQYYLRATRKLRQVLLSGQPSKVLVLICCLLFHAFDAARGNTTAAVQHLSTGLDIFDIVYQERQSTSSSSDRNALDSQELLETMAAMIWGGYHNAIQYANYDKPTSVEKWSFKTRPYPAIVRSVHHASQPKIPPMFNSLAEAVLISQRINNKVWNIIGQYRTTPIEDLPAEYFIHKQTALDRYEAWMASLDNFLQNQLEIHKASSEGITIYQAVALMKMTQIFQTTSIHAHMPENPEYLKSAENPEFDEILSLAESLLMDDQYAPGSDQAIAVHNFRHGYSMSSGVLIDLFMIAHNTTHAHYYDRATSLMLLADHRREGTFDTHTLMRMIPLMKAAQAQ